MKTIHPAIAEHVMEENEKLRGLLREALTELLAMKAEIGFRGNTIAVIGRIDAALSTQGTSK